MSALLIAEAKKSGAAKFVASTTVDNAAARSLLTGSGAELTVAGDAVESELRLR
ncbi:hypothetical protein [Amycolatopsis sp. CA-230715]|uniref:hypothetical protein n=1 Tax=Amycolatopsis sp. CA-230715 TaxID=2745196 RepID=UPI001C039431|nr:hypothetical protein [Amycolatopsis sp. CA-230715]QWF82865.1 hypothetical protein HUW46_06304 [Amycolatopsis sp. CA-230715]